MSYQGYEFINIKERNVKGNKYLTAQFSKNIDEKEYPYRKTKQEIFDMVKLQSCLVNIVTGNISYSQSDINQLMEGMAALRKAYKENPDCKFSWSTASHITRKGYAKNRIEEHNNMCINLLENSPINKKHEHVDFKFEPIPSNE